MNYALKFNVTTETLYPYQGINGACRQRVLTATGRQTVFKQRSPVAVGFTQVTTNNVTAIKQAIRYSPTAFYFRVESPFQLYNGGIFSTPCTGTSVNHAMLMYGYVQPLTGSGYWRIKNSWGVNWGEGGTMRLQIPLTASSTSAGICRAHGWHYLPNDDNIFPV
jgi:KDEL-tailed cysteine endopeptidase